MPVNLQVGIFWDPREPPPPEYQPPIQQHVIYHPPSPQRPEANDNPLSPTSQSILHPLSTSLVAKLVHDTATVSVTQLFWNKTNSTIGKGTYSFPLPAGCTVVDFNCRIGSNKIVRGRVKPKQEAREAFNDAARRDQTATLLEQDTPEIFTTTLANIPANTKLKAEISFITILKHKFLDSTTATMLIIPTCIASRYDTPPNLQHTQSISRSQELSIQIEVLAVEDITSIISKTHNVNVQMGATTSNSQSWSEFVVGRTTVDPRAAVVTLTDRVPFLDRDFVLDITTLPPNGAETPHAFVETHPSFEGHKAVMLTIPPKFMLENESPVHDAEILFVADRSGSMEDKIESLKSAMTFFLKGIPQAQRFNVWCFGTSHTYLWPRSKKYSESTLREALAYVSQQFASDLGGTELLPALKAIVDARGGFEMTDVILLTDGQVWRLNETLDFIQQTRRTTGGRVRFFALGIGDAVSHELVEGIAKAGGGYAEAIPAASQGGWEDRLVAVLHASLTGHIGPLRIEFAREDGQEIEIDLEMGGGGSRPGVLQSPFKISALSPFLRNRVFMLLDSANSPTSFDAIHIKATTPNGHEVVTRVPVKSLHKKATTLHHLGARALLGDLERGQSWIHLSSHEARRNVSEEQFTRQEGERLGIKWSLVSKWTSFYAIEEPYEAPEHVQDPFLDADEQQIHHIVANDLNLLRPRGQPNLIAVDALRLELGAPTEDQTEEEDDSTSGSDFTDTEDVNHDNSDDSGSDDDGAGAGGNGVSRRRSAGHSRGPDPGQTGRARQEGEGGSGSGDRTNGLQGGSNHEAAQERVQHMPSGPEYISAYGNSTSPPDQSRSRVTSLASDNTSTRNHPLIRNTTTRSSMPLMSLAHMSSLTSPVSFQTSVPSPLSAATSPVVSSQLPSSLSPPPSALHSTPFTNSKSALRSSDKYPRWKSSSASREFWKSQGDSPSALPTNALPSTVPGKPSLDVVPESQSLPAPKTKKSLSSVFKRLAVAKSTKAETVPKSWSSAPLPPPRRTSDHGSISKLSSDKLLLPPPREVYQDARENMSGMSELSSHRRWGSDEDLTQPWELASNDLLPAPDIVRSAVELSMESEFGRNSCEKYRTSIGSPLPSQIFEMSAPIHNPPASTAIFQTGAITKSDKDIGDQSRVRRLVALQNFDGSFHFDGEGHIESFFGKDFCTAIHEIELNLYKISINQAEKYKIAVAIAIIVELEESFQSCKDLWLLIVKKARHFVDIWLGGFEKEQVFDFAKDLLALNNIAREGLGLNNQPLADWAEDQTRDSAATKLADTTTWSTKSQTKPEELHFVPNSVLDSPGDGLHENSRSLIQNITLDDGTSSSTPPKKSSWKLGRKIQSKFQSKFEKTKSREATTKSGRRPVEEHGSEPVDPPLAPNVPISAFERSGQTSFEQLSQTTAPARSGKNNMDFSEKDMMPKQKTQRVHDPYAIDFWDKDEYEAAPKPKAALSDVANGRQILGWGQDGSALAEL